MADDKQVDALPGARFVYLLDVPLAQPATQGAVPRYSCCHQTESQGHARACREDKRESTIRSILKRAGFPSLAPGLLVPVGDVPDAAALDDRRWLAELLNNLPHIDPHDDEGWLVDSLPAPYVRLLRRAVEARDHKREMDKPVEEAPTTIVGAARVAVTEANRVADEARRFVGETDPMYIQGTVTGRIRAEDKPVAPVDLADDPVNHPPHYNDHPAGIECVEVTEHMTANIAAAVKYLWRAGLKPGAEYDQDLAKAVWYLERERLRARMLPKNTAAWGGGAR